MRSLFKNSDDNFSPLFNIESFHADEIMSERGVKSQINACVADQSTVISWDLPEIEQGLKERHMKRVLRRGRRMALTLKNQSWRRWGSSMRRFSLNSGI
jgi:hypothetical protein